LHEIFEAVTAIAGDVFKAEFIAEIEDDEIVSYVNDKDDENCKFDEAFSNVIDVSGGANVEHDNQCNEERSVIFDGLNKSDESFIT
jgi:hypothetical protein